ncbi:hypothetical protein Hanom_Chr07g00631751 [Helianthus anomalus]
MRVAAMRPKQAASLFLSPGMASSEWVSFCLLTVHFPIVLNAMGINTRRSPQSFRFFLSNFFQISKFSPFFYQFFSISCSSPLVILTTMSTSSKAATSKKTQSKPKDPPGLNRAVIIWKEEFHNLVQRFKFLSDWGAQYPITGSTAMDAPPGYMALYVAFFREGNFRPPMSNFLGEIHKKYVFGVPKVVLAGSYADREWYKTLTKMPTPIIQLEEKALVAAGMSLMWVPREPRAAPVYAYKGKASYSLLNVFDPKVGGEMTTMLLPAGEPTWTARIRDNFLHPPSESITAYGTVILGAASVSKSDRGKSPTREGTILLSNEESTGSSHELIHRSSRAGPRQRPV